jgi:phosphoribosyl 1,2-cyclic phosphate phosphodiesterase
MPHGPMDSTGFKFDCDGKTISYAVDFSTITDEMVALFRGTDILVVDCLRYDPHPTHAHVAMAMELIERTGARQAVLTHLDKTLDYQELSAKLPGHIMVGFDGLILDA